MDFQHHTILGHLDKRDHRLCGVIGICHIHDDFFADGLRDTLLHREEPLYSTVLFISDIIETGDIHAWKFCGPAQKLDSVKSLLPAFLVQIQKITVSCLSFSNIENIKKISQGFRIVGTWTAPDNYRTVFPPVSCIDGNLGQIQHLEHIGVTHFILQRDSQKIELFHRILRFQRKQRDMLLSHDSIQIYPWRIDSLAPYIPHGIEHIVQDLDPKMRHADFIHIRKTHGKAHRHFGRIFHDRVIFAAYIPDRLFYAQ